jgi:hypothetical protein
MKRTKVFLLLTLAVGLAMSSAAVAGNLQLKPYGFVKGDLVYASTGVYSFGGTNLMAAQRVNPADSSAALGFTAQHTRFGLKGTAGEDFKVGGCVELDFFTGSGFDANAGPRMRLAYASVARKQWEVRVGQQWDLFSPNNASTNNTNGNMWYAGNYGFRRPMFQFIYKFVAENLDPKLQLAIAEATKEGSGLGMDNYAVLPMVQGRLSGMIQGKYGVGVYFAYASYDACPDEDDSDYDFTTTGFGADVNIPFTDQVSLKGEVNMGTNLNNANLFSIAGSGSRHAGTGLAEGEEVVEDDRDSMGFWANLTAKASDKVHFVLGFGMEKNQTDDLAAGTLEQNTVIYGDVIFPIAEGFCFAVEVESITSAYADTDQIEVDDESAVVIDVAGKITF